MLKKISQFPRIHIFAAGSLSVAIGAALLMNPSTKVEANRVSVPIAIQGSTTANSPSSAVAEPQVSTAQQNNAPQPALATAPSTANLPAPKVDASVLVDINSADVSDSTSTANDNAPYRELTDDGADTSPQTAWQSFKVGSGDSLAVIFQRAGLNSQDVFEVTSADKEGLLSRIYPGNTLDFDIQNGKLEQLRLKLNRLESVEVKRDAKDQLVAEKVTLTPDARPTYGAGTITSSLFLAGQQAGLSQGMIMQLAKIFGYDIDFGLDIREGDNFNVVYEELYLNGKKIGYGDILAASFTNQGHTYKAVRYVDRDGNTSYFRPNGESLRKAFIRTPVDFARISSSFSLGRYHPILNKIRAHKGTDYAASIGTPIKAAGDGKVIFKGVKGGYGNVIMLQHGGDITTVYGHMNGFARGIQVGTRVHQSQIIGYVGMTGLATGPHLHYEFRVHGVAKNPVTVPLPKAAPIAASEMARFKTQTASSLAELDAYTQSNHLALNGQ